MNGLAIYASELNAAQVLKHYEDWTQHGQPTLAKLKRFWPCTCFVSARA